MDLRSGKLYFFLLLLLLLPLSSYATEPYTLPQLIELALKNRPEMNIAMSRLAESRSLLKEAKSYYYPQLDLNLRYSHWLERPYVVVPRTMVNAGIDLSGIKADYPILAAIPDQITVPITIPQTKAEIAGQDVFKVITELKQPLFTGGKIKEKVRQAHHLIDITRSQKVGDSQQIVFQVKSLYFQLVFADRAIRVVRNTEQRLRVVTKFLENLYKNYVPKEGEEGVTKGDYLKAKHVLAKVLHHISEARRIRDEARKSLMLACGLKTSGFYVSGEVERYKPHIYTDDLEGLKRLALANRPELRQLSLAENISSSEVKRAKAGYIPDIGIFGFYERIEDDLPGSEENRLVGGIGASIPIFNGLRTDSEIKKAKAANRKVKSQRELMRLKISLEIEELYTRLQDHLRKVSIWRGALAHARERRQLESESYLLEAANYEDYLKALEDEVTTHISLIKSRAGYYITLANLELACGL